MVLADGDAVSVAVQVILAADEVHALLANVVHVTVGAVGALESTCIVVADAKVE